MPKKIAEISDAARRGVAVTIDDKGRLVIPRAIREQLGLRTGDAVYCRGRRGVIHCVKAENPFDVLAEHARREFKAGRTKSLRQYASEHANRANA